MNQLPIVAICGPYYGDGAPNTIAANITEAEQYAIALANVGVGFFCPHTHTRHFETKTTAGEAFYHQLDFTILTRAADAALFTPRWGASAGARVEHDLAQQLSMPRFYPSSPDDLGEITQWAQSWEGQQ